MAELVAKVTDATFTRKVTVTATGVVSTGGWTHAMLSPFVYFVQPADRIQDYSFSATPPDGPSTQVETPITSEPADVPQWAVGVRIHAAQNTLTRKIGEED